MQTAGDLLRRLRKEQRLLLKEVAKKLSIDPAVLGKIERNQRLATEDQINALAKFYKGHGGEIKELWLSDNISDPVTKERMAFSASEVAEEKTMYQTGFNIGSEKEIIQKISDFLRKDGRVKKAWIFGSFTRGDQKPGSDVDLKIRYSEKASGTLFDYADIQFQLSELLNIKVDLVEEGFVKPFALKTIKRDLKGIYG